MALWASFVEAKEQKRQGKDTVVVLLQGTDVMLRAGSALCICTVLEIKRNKYDMLLLYSSEGRIAEVTPENSNS